MKSNSLKRKENVMAGKSPNEGIYIDSNGYDHDCVRCESMTDSDCLYKPIFAKGSCCVCEGHDCDAAKIERAKHPENIAPYKQPGKNHK